MNSQYRYDDLRGFIDIISKRGELKVIEGADPDLEMGALTVLIGKQSKDHPAILFDKIKGYSRGFRVLSNTLSTMSRSKLGMGIDPDLDLGDPVEYLAGMLEKFKPIPPREVSDGPVMENVQTEAKVDLSKFPAPKWHLLDGGRYLGTGTLVILRDPDTGTINLGTYRMQLHDNRTLTIVINPGHHGQIIRDRYWERGESCPVAFTLGHDPRLATAADMSAPWGQSEYHYAGWLRGEPVEVIPGPVTGLPIPSRAEIAIEGEIPPDSEEARNEGPFGEFGGYYSVESKPQPVIRVKAVYYRDNPIALGSPPFRGIRHDGVLPLAEAILYLELKRVGFPEVKKLSRFGPFLVVAMRPRYAGHARRIADFVMSGVGMRPPKYVVIVDDDIDPLNADDVLWALQTRVDVEDSIHIVRNRWASPTDPRIPPDKKASGDISAPSLIIDATRPWGWRDRYPKPSDFPQEVLEKYRAKWSSQLAP